LFNAYFEDFIKDPPETFDPETLKRYRACLKHLNRFNNSRYFRYICRWHPEFVLLLQLGEIPFVLQTVPGCLCYSASLTGSNK